MLQAVLLLALLGCGVGLGLDRPTGFPRLRAGRLRGRAGLRRGRRRRSSRGLGGPVARLLGRSGGIWLPLTLLGRLSMQARRHGKHQDRGSRGDGETLHATSSEGSGWEAHGATVDPTDPTPSSPARSQPSALSPVVMRAPVVYRSIVCSRLDAMRIGTRVEARQSKPARPKPMTISVTSLDDPKARALR